MSKPTLEGLVERVARYFCALDHRDPDRTEFLEDDDGKLRDIAFWESYADDARRLIDACGFEDLL
jgi:hypothetical protein